MADIDDLIDYAANQQPTRFADAFDQLMRDRIAGRIEDEKLAYAQQMFQTDDEEDLEDVEDGDDLDIEDFDDEDFEFDDEFEDEDLDLDFDDTDLEEVEDNGEDS